MNRPLRIAQIDLITECTGEAEPTLVFVHGFGSDRHEWSQQVTALAPRFRCVTFDMPGHGESGLPLTGDIEVLAGSVCNITTRHGPGPIVLVGHRLGCRVVLEAMSLCPDDVAGLVLVETKLLGGDDAEGAADAIEAQVRAMGFHTLIGPLVETMFLPGSNLNLRRSALKGLRQLDPVFATEALVSAIRWEARAPTQLAELTVPVLLLQSTYLNGNPDGHSLQPGTTWTEQVTRLVSDTRLHVIPGADQLSQTEASTIVSARIGEFAERLRPRSAGARLQ